MPEGASLVVFNGDGLDYHGEIAGIQRQGVRVRLGEGVDPHNESALEINLVQAISRGDRMDYCLQKATELGVSRIQLIEAERVELRLKSARLEKRMAHWRGVIISACEQSGRARVPELSAPVALPRWLKSRGASRCLVLAPQANLPLASVALGAEPVNIMVGPEGGFSQGEIDLALAEGVAAVSLGPRVLRTETAGPAAIAVLQSVAGDFQSP